jgi:radical SAM protein with 4Fe4S-binding SPASM domain
MTLLAPQPRPHAELDGPGLPPALPRQDPITGLPVLILYPHARCNCRCVMCDIWKVRSRDEITPEEVGGWLPELAALGVERVVLSGGEALLHSRLEEVCAALRGAGIGVTLITTGLLLRRDAEWLVRLVDDVVTSLDGPPDVHDAVRRIPGAFAKLAAGVRAVRDADAARAAGAGGRPDSQVRITARCTVQRLNHDRLRGTVDAARSIGLDGISFLAADVSSEAFNRPGGWDTETAQTVALDESELGALGEELARLEREHALDFESGFIAESPSKLRGRIHGHFSALLGRGDFARHACNAPWVSTVIEADGTVRPCFFHAPLGNIREAGSLAAVINSPAARAWRRQLDVQKDETCRRCVCTLTLRSGDGRTGLPAAGSRSPGAPAGETAPGPSPGSPERPA